MNTHHQTIIDAIQEMKRIRLTYDGFDRTVEPHAYGRAATGNDLLRCYQTAGDHKSEKPHDWDLLNVAKITTLVVSEDGFSEPRRAYKRDDKAMKTIYAQL